MYSHLSVICVWLYIHGSTDSILLRFVLNASARASAMSVADLASNPISETFPGFSKTASFFLMGCEHDKFF